MATDKSSKNLLFALTAVVAAVVPPGAALTYSSTLREHPWLAVLAILLYEALGLVMTFTVSVSGEMRKLWVQRTVIRFDAWLQRLMSRYTREYLRYVSAETSHLDTKGLNTVGEFSLRISDILVDLSLVSTPVHHLSSHPLLRNQNVVGLKQASVWQWLSETDANASVLAIIGPPGSGKTTVLKAVANALAASERKRQGHRVINRLPVLVNLRDHKNWISSCEDATLVDLLRRALPPVDRAEPPNWLETNLRAGRFALLFDGLDEIGDADLQIKFVDWLERQISAQRRNVIVLTSRPGGYRNSPMTGATVTEVQPLKQDQIYQFTHKWYRAITARSHGDDLLAAQLTAGRAAEELMATLLRNANIFDLATNPLLLTMICNVHHYRGALPGSRAELYEEICDVLLGKRQTARKIEIVLTVKQRLLIVKRLALHMMQQKQNEISVDDASAVLADELVRFGHEIKPDALLEQIEHSSGVMLEKERGLYAFCHLTFQEYLAANLLAYTSNGAELVLAANDPWWNECIRFYASMTDASDVVLALIGSGLPGQVALAAQCLGLADEASVEARQAVADTLQPRDARDERSARQLAAHARLLLMFESGWPLELGRTLSREVTSLEYQLFIDSSGDHAPDSWPDVLYPKGTDERAIVGIRYGDARAFCDWLQHLTGTGAKLRLAERHELASAIRENALQVGEGAAFGFWEAARSRAGADRFWPLVREEASLRRASPYLGTTNPKELIGSHITRLLAEEAGQVSPYSGESSLDDSLAFTSFLRNLVERHASDVTDLGQAAADSAYARDIAIGLSERNDTTPLGHMHAALAAQADLVAVACESYSKERSAPTTRRGLQSSEARKDLRGATLTALRLCWDLYRAHDGQLLGPTTNEPGGLMPPVEAVVASASSHVTNPSMLPNVVTCVLAHAYAAIYVELAALEVGSAPIRDVQFGKLVLVRDLTDTTSTQARFDLGDVTMTRPSGPWVRIKPILEPILAAVMVLALSPLMLIISILVRATDPGPALSKQTRVGRNGEKFQIYKFRTMYVDADEKLDDILRRNESEGVLFKIRQDPRVTPLGHFLRRYSLDEFPQLFNVIIGDMALVGPRPPHPSEVVYNDPATRTKFTVKPGITGLWQVSGRSDLSWDEALRLDTYYATNVSFVADIAILARTVSAILIGRGRY